MEWWGWVGWAVGLLGAVFGVRGELRAHQAEQRRRQDEQVSPWDEARWLGGDLFAVKNSSTRDVVVTSVSPDFVPQAEPANNFEARGEFPFTVSAGDSVEFWSRPRYTLSRPRAVIEWRFSDSKQTRTTRRTVDGLDPDGH